MDHRSRKSKRIFGMSSSVKKSRNVVNTNDQPQYASQTVDVESKNESKLTKEGANHTTSLPKILSQHSKFQTYRDNESPGRQMVND